MRRMDRINANLIRTVVPPEATREQFALLQTYLASRHARLGGGSRRRGASGVRSFSASSTRS
jgi:arginine-tRNA-protein transferase